MTASDYEPKTMHHPGYQKGTFKPIPGSDNGRGPAFLDYQGTPDRFPPVTVNNPDQEAQHRAKGYALYGESTMNAIAFREYPLMMNHPKYKPGVPMMAATLNGANQVITPEIPAIAPEFPPMIVNNEDEESAAAEKGYARPGRSDPDAAHAAISSPYDPTRVKSEYPKMVDGRMVEDPSTPSGVQEYPKWVGDKLVKSRTEEDTLTGVVRAAAPALKAASPVQVSRDPLERAAAPAGESKFDRAQRLKAEADAALAEAEAEMLREEAVQSDIVVRDVVTDDALEADMLVAAEPLTPSEQAAEDRRTVMAELDAKGITYSNRWPTPKLKAALEGAAA